MGAYAETNEFPTYVNINLLHSSFIVLNGLFAHKIMVIICNELTSMTICAKALIKTTFGTDTTGSKLIKTGCLFIVFLLVLL